MITIRVNGQPQTLGADLTLAALLEQLKLDPRRVVVERNRELITAERFPGVDLHEGDVLELVQFMGGG